MTPTTDETRPQTIERLAKQAADAEVLKNKKGETLVISAGEVIDRSHPDDAPGHHIRERVTHSTVESFCDYVERFKQPGTAVFSSEAAVIAKIDGHSPDQAGFNQHSAVLTPRPTAQATRLRELSGEWVERGVFAEALLMLREEIVEPESVRVLELVQHLNVSKSVEFSEGERLADGSRTLNFVESQTATGGGAGKIAVPSLIQFKLALHRGGPEYQIAMDFRYRLREATLQLHLGFSYWDEIDAQAMDDMRDLVKAKLGDIPIYDQ